MNNITSMQIIETTGLSDYSQLDARGNSVLQQVLCRNDILPSTEVIQFAKARGLNINNISNNGLTAFLSATGSLGACDRLLYLGANPTIFGPPGGGDTALDYVVSPEYAMSPHFARVVISYCKDQGLSVDTVNPKYGSSPLYRLVTDTPHRFLEILNACKEKGYRPFSPEQLQLALELTERDKLPCLAAAIKEAMYK
jgi:hypothetical protein